MQTETKTSSSARAARGALALAALLLALAPAAHAAEPFHPRDKALDVSGLNHACGAAVDSKGDLYLSSAGTSEVKVYDPSHTLLTSIPDSNTPCSLAVTATGALYASERATGEVVRFEPSEYPPTASTTYAETTIDASGNAEGIAVDPFDNRLYVAEGTRVSSYGAKGELGIDEVQQVNLFGTTGGAFKLRFKGQETGSIPFDAPAGLVAEELEALSTIGGHDVGVESKGEKAWLVTFTGTLGHEDVPMLEGDASGLTGSSPSVSIAETTKSWSGRIGEGVLVEATGVASYTAEPTSEIFGLPGTDRSVWVADAAGLQEDRLDRFGGQDIRSLSLRRELKGENTPSGSFGFGPSGAALAADPGDVIAKKCAPVGGEACTAGHLYLYDAAHEALEEFDGSGEFLDQAKNAAFADAGPSAIAIDRSGGANDGTVYLTAGQGAGAAALALGPLPQPSREILAPPVSKLLPSVAALATDSHGDVYAAAGAKIHVYAPGGAEIATPEAKPLLEDKGGAKDLAVDSKCDVYVLDGEAKVGYYAPSTGACPPTSTTTYTRHEVAKAEEFPLGGRALRGIAVNPGPSAGKDRLFVTGTKVTREYDTAEDGSTLLDAEFGKAIPTGIRESVAVDGANGDVYISANPPGLIYSFDPTGEEILARIDARVSTSGKPDSNPHLAVDEASGHVIEFDGELDTAHEYDPVANGYVAEYGDFTEGLVKPYRVAVDNACALHELDETTTPTCHEFDPADGTVYVAFDDTNESHPPYDVTAFGRLSYSQPVKHKVTVKREGSGSGGVAGGSAEEPGTIACAPTCSHEYPETAVVRLEASAGVNSEFKQWEGCENPAPTQGDCEVTPSEDLEVTAIFEKKSGTPEFPLTLKKSGAGEATVTSTPAGIACGPGCEEEAAEFVEGAEVELAAAAPLGSEILAWSGCEAQSVSVREGACTVTMDEAKEVEVQIGEEHPLLSVAKHGGGTGKVSSEDGLIDCGGTCSHKYDLEAEVTLEAEADPGSKFIEWEGCEEEPEPQPGEVLCEVKMDEPEEITATFASLPGLRAVGAHPIAYTEATLRGEVDPAGPKAEYRFEYLTEGKYDENGESFEGAKLATEGELEPGEAFVAVQAALFGLAEGTAYRFRLVAENAVGASEGEGTFETLRRAAPQSCPNAEYRFGLSAKLPDCRAYELVTPAQTNGLPPYATDDGGTDSKSFSNWLTVQRGEAAGERLSYFTDGTLPGFEGNGRRDGYRAERGVGDHPLGGWQSAVVSPDYAQAGGSQPQQHGIAPDQLYSIWEPNAASEPLPGGLSPHTVFLRTPGGFEPIGEGSLGIDHQALSRYLGPGGRHAIFSSKAHLEPLAAPEGTAALYDRSAGDAGAEVISVRPDGSPFGGGEDAAYLGADEEGSAVAFSVAGKLYLHRDRQTFAITEGANTFAGFSEDGKRIFYAAAGDGKSAAPLYVCDTEAGPCAGEDAHEPTEIADSGIFALVSPDGGHVFFSSEEVLGGEGEENENCDPECEKAEAGARNLYAWDGTQTHFVARLAAADFENEGFAGIPGMSLAAWTQALSISEFGGRALAPTRATPAGGVLVFQSHAQLTEYDNEGMGEIYRYDPTAAVGERLVCVSCDPSGAAPSSDALLEDVRSSSLIKPKTMIANLTDDGQEVFFQSFDRLVPEDANEAEDVFEWRAKGTEGPGGDVCERPGGCLALISSGQGEVPSVLYAMSADGHDVFFETKEKLVGTDVPGSPSIYDARVGGGIPEPIEAAPCQGDACQGQGALPPGLPAPASTGAGEAGEVSGKPKPRCGKGKRLERRHGKRRCVAKRHHRRHRRHRRRHGGRRRRARAERGGGRR